MEQLFISYEIAKKLKGNGFDEPCFGYYENESRKLILNYTNQPSNHPEAEKRPSMFITDNRNSVIPQWAIAAPTYQQVADWFRDKHNLHFYIVPQGDMRCWSLAGLEGWELPNIARINKTERADRLFFDIREKYNGVKFNTYYEAIKTAINEAIELIK